VRPPLAKSRVLLIEDNPGDARLLRELFAEQTSHAIALTHVECMRDGEAHLLRRTTDVILLDLDLPDARGLEAVRRARTAAPRVPLVVLTGTDDERLAVQALEEGAQDYLVKGQLETRGLLRSLRYAIARKLLEEALFVEKERAQVTLDCIGEGVICTNLPGNITFLNAVARTMTGWSWEQAAGHPLDDVFHMLDAAGPEPAQHGSGRDELLAAGCVLVRRDGFQTAIENTIAPIRDRAGQPTGSVIVFRDVSEARAMALKMIHSAQHDFLTGLPNRLLLKERISQAIGLAQRHGTQLALLYLDLDGFKHINDSLGHPIGDKLLQSVAGRLLACARSSDTVSRHGGDEFIVLLSEVRHADDASAAVSRILQAVAAVHSIGRHQLHISTSIGVSVFPDDGQDAETLIKNADTALYHAKEDARHGFQYFKPAMNARAVERQFLEESLRRALERSELSLHYQPKIEFKTGTIVGAEALLRWTHPTRGAISPAIFIPIAEDCGLIKRIGSWVMREACDQACAWTRAGLPEMTIAVNVSAAEFRGDRFLEGVFEALHATGLEPRRLELELTESALMTHTESATSILQAVRARGVHVAIDDFGTGYSSLSYLQKFAVDALKIDQSFVTQISETGEETGLVIAVISMAQSLKLRVIAEGVETIEQLRFLRDHHCDEAQGFYFSQPVPAPQFAQLLSMATFRPPAFARS
jgi:diguanylate cyclase (GGDEF)-like protein/PAS domain S-box-containing protein